MKKTDKWNEAGEHAITADKSCRIEAYKLAATDVCHERRNFPGYATHTPGEALMNSISCEGTTDTRGGKDMNHAYNPDKMAHLTRKFK